MSGALRVHTYQPTTVLETYVPAVCACLVKHTDIIHRRMELPGLILFLRVQTKVETNLGFIIR